MPHKRACQGEIKRVRFDLTRTTVRYIEEEEEERSRVRFDEFKNVVRYMRNPRIDSQLAVMFILYTMKEEEEEEEQSRIRRVQEHRQVHV